MLLVLCSAFNRHSPRYNDASMSFANSVYICIPSDKFERTATGVVVMRLSWPEVDQRILLTGSLQMTRLVHSMRN